MTLGQLADKLRELQEAEQAMRDAEQALDYGGNADTMATKRAWLRDCERILSDLRAEVITL